MFIAINKHSETSLCKC